MILDTNALSDYADGVPEAAAVVAASAVVALPVVVLGEYRYGIAHSRRRESYTAWLEEFLAVCTILDVTNETTRWYASVRSQLRQTGTPIPENDNWIAALALQHDLVLMSRDQHFDRVKGIRRVAW